MKTKRWMKVMAILVVFCLIGGQLAWAGSTGKIPSRNGGNSVYGPTNGCGANRRRGLPTGNDDFPGIPYKPRAGIVISPGTTGRPDTLGEALRPYLQGGLMAGLILLPEVGLEVRAIRAGIPICRVLTNKGSQTALQRMTEAMERRRYIAWLERISKTEPGIDGLGRRIEPTLGDQIAEWLDWLLGD